MFIISKSLGKFNLLTLPFGYGALTKNVTCACGTLKKHQGRLVQAGKVKNSLLGGSRPCLRVSAFA
jgi:hypothetical protein